MARTEIHAQYVGRTVEVTDTRSIGNVFTPDFPGWTREFADQPKKADGGYVGLEPVRLGARATVTGTESHGSYPYTRLVLDFEDGSHTGGVDPQAVRVVA